MLLLLLCAAFPVVCASAFCCFCGCFLGRRQLNPTLAAHGAPGASGASCRHEGCKQRVDGTKVLTKHAVLQGFCGNALKLLANQREDGRPHTNLGRKGLAQGLREFMNIDNQRALEFGYLGQGMGKIQCTKAESSRRMPRGDGQESPDELTLRAEEGGASNTHINVDHTEKER